MSPEDFEEPIVDDSEIEELVKTESVQIRWDNIPNRPINSLLRLLYNTQIEVLKAHTRTLPESESQV